MVYFNTIDSTGILEDTCSCKKHTLLSQKINVFPNQSWLFATNFVSTVKQLKSLPASFWHNRKNMHLHFATYECAKLNFNGKRILAKINIDWIWPGIKYNLIFLLVNHNS